MLRVYLAFDCMGFHGWQTLEDVVDFGDKSSVDSQSVDTAAAVNGYNGYSTAE